MAGVPERGLQPSEQIGSAGPQPFADPSAFGSGVGAALAEAGQALHADRVRALQIDKQQQEESANAQAGVAAAELSVNLTKLAQDARDGAPLDGTGHVDTVAAGSDQLVGGFLGAITDKKVREHWTARAAEMRGNLISDEDGWARGRRLKSIGSNATEAQRLLANQLQGNPDPQSLEQSFKAGETFWAGVTAPADLKDQGVREWKATMAENYGTGMVEKDPAGGLAVLQSGVLDQWLGSDTKRKLIDRAESGVRIAGADARRAAAQAEAQLRQDVVEYQQRIDRGELPSDKETADLAGRAHMLGLANLVDDIGYSSGTLKMSRETDKWTPAEWAGHVDPLAAKVAQGKASADEQMQLKILQGLRPGKEARFRADPDSAAAASGIAPPQVDIANPDPGSIAARKSWAQSFARTGGLVEPPYLNKDQLTSYRDRALQGPVAQLEVASEIKQQWGDAATSIVRQIGGDVKADMTIMLGLNSRMAQVYVRGHEALAKKLVKLNDDQFRQQFDLYSSAVPPDLRPALFDAARTITAGWMSEQGKSEPTADYHAVIAQAIHRAGGMLGSVGGGSATGGFANWNGRFAWLPQDMSRNDLQARLTRAAPRDWIAAAVDGQGNPTAAVPHHLGADGKPVPYKNGEALRFSKGTLQTVAPGIYQLLDPAGGTIVDAQGRPWQFDVRRLPRSHVVSR